MQNSASKDTKKLKKHVDQLSSDKDPKKLRVSAIKYDIQKDRAPKIVASGRGAIAQDILRLAEENRVPLYEDPNLAELLSKLDLETEVPPVLFPLVAEVLALVYQLEIMSKKRETLKKHFSGKASN